MNDLNRIVRPLLTWYRENKRTLPWRTDADPYRVWISEIMLQQTRVDTVIPYYERFLRRLPTLRDLADAPEEVLLKLWEGLGYYSRARNLQKAARTICEEYGGVFPDRYEQLLRLPGIGAYTAGAIASIAFGQPVPAVDGNVLRVLSRVTGSRDDITDPAARVRFTQALSRVYPAGECSDFTQSLMELGAIVCVPNGPARCADCPLAALCTACLDGSQNELPVKAPKPARRCEDKTVFMLLRDGRVAVRKRADGGLLGGLWEFPAVDGVLNADGVRKQLSDWGLTPSGTDRLPVCRHIFTHVEWNLYGWKIDCAGEASGFVWVKPDELDREIALPTAFAKLKKYL